MVMVNGDGCRLQVMFAVRGCAVMFQVEDWRSATLDWGYKKAPKSQVSTSLHIHTIMLYISKRCMHNVCFVYRSLLNGFNDT